MSDNEVDTCYKCRYSVKSVGEKGFCKLYNHHLSDPDVICQSFQAKISEENINNHIDIKHNTKSSSIGNPSVILYTVSCFALTVVWMIIAVYFSFYISSVDELPIVLKGVFSASLFAVIILLLVLAFWSGKRFRAARIIEITLAVVNMVFVLMFYDTLLNQINLFAAKLIEIFI